MAAAQTLGHEDTFYWIASDGWGKQQQVIADLEEVAAGAITIDRAPSGAWFCDKDMSLQHNNAYEQDSKVQFVIDAVYEFVYALQKMKHDLCRL